MERNKFFKENTQKFLAKVIDVDLFKKTYPDCKVTYFGQEPAMNSEDKDGYLINVHAPEGKFNADKLNAETNVIGWQGSKTLMLNSNKETKKPTISNNK